MKTVRIPLRRLAHAAGLPLPQYMTAGAAGMDLLAAVEKEVTIPPGGFLPIPTGLQMLCLKASKVQVRPRSGLAARLRGDRTGKPAGTIDSDYRARFQSSWSIMGLRILWSARRPDRRSCRGRGGCRGGMEEVTGDLAATARGEGGFWPYRLDETGTAKGGKDGGGWRHDQNRGEGSGDGCG